MPDPVFDFGELQNSYKSYEQQLKDDLINFKKNNSYSENRTTDVINNDPRVIKNKEKKTSNNSNSSFEKQDFSIASDIGKSFISEGSEKSKELTDVDTSKLSAKDIGNNALASSGEVLQFGASIGDTLSNTSNSESESWAKTGQLTMQGAQLGMQIGGPVGAAVGGVGGAAVGIVDLIGDTKKRNNAASELYRNNLKENATRREQEQRMSDGEKSLKKLQTLRKAQLGYINTSY